MREIALSDERELLRQARELDETALATIFDLYYRPLYRYIYHHVGNVATAEDHTAEVFRRFLEQVTEKRGPKDYLRAWLFRVAHNLVVDEARRNARRPQRALNEEIVAGGPDVAGQAHNAILHEQAHEALARLTARQREVIILKFLEGLENEEIARILRLSVGAVKALQHRGLGAMRRHLIQIGAVAEEW